MYLITIKQTNIAKLNSNGSENTKTTMIKQIYPTYQDARETINQIVLEEITHMIANNQKFLLDMRDINEYDAKITDTSDSYVETEYAIMECAKATRR